MPLSDSILSFPQFNLANLEALLLRWNYLSRTGWHPSPRTVYELPLPTGKALVFTDILFNLNKSYFQQHLPPGEFLLQWLGTSAMGSSGFFGITGLGRRFFMTERHADRQWLEALADSVPDLQVISVAHGRPSVENCNSRLREAAARLL